MSAMKEAARRAADELSTLKSVVEKKMAEEEKIEQYVIPKEVLQLAINTLAEQSYKEVGDLVNALRSCQPLSEENEDG